MHIGLRIDPVTNDLTLAADGQLSLVRNAEAVGQHVRQRLKTFEGEWFLDNTAGVVWLQQILGKAYDPALAEAVVKAEILDTHGVAGIIDFDVSFARTQRNLVIKDVAINTTYNTQVRL